MLATLSILLALQKNWLSKPLFPEMFPNPTGANGLEEYVLGTDFLRQGHFNAYNEWFALDDLGEGAWTKPISRFTNDTQAQPDPRYVSLLNRIIFLDYLQVRQEEERVFGQALNFVRIGNDKAFFLPPIQADTKFPTVTDVLGIGKLSIDSSYASLAQGESQNSVNTLGQLLLMSNRLAHRNYFSTLVSIVNFNRVCTLVNDRLNSYSMDDARLLEQFASLILNEPPACIEACQREMEHAKQSVGGMILESRKQGSNPSHDKVLDAVSQQLNTLNDTDVAAVIEHVQQAIGERCLLVLKAFSEPESSWSKSATEDNSKPNTPPKSIIDVEHIFANGWTPSFATNSKPILAILASRTQLRLLRLHARIISYRWEWGRLPSDLNELKLPVNFDFDPLSNQNFVYELSGDHYRLFSRGNRMTGEIELNYQYAPSFGVPQVRA